MEEKAQCKKIENSPRLRFYVKSENKKKYQNQEQINCQNVWFWKSKNGKLFSRKIRVTEKSLNFYTVRGRLLIASRGHEVVGFMIHKRKIEEILISQTIPLLYSYSHVRFLEQLW